MHEGRQRFTIIACTEVYSGTGKSSGKPYSIYEVEALDEAGILVQDRLRSFRDLRLNELLAFNVEHYVHPRQGDTWTLYPL
jgi:hypothetical protein